MNLIKKKRGNVRLENISKQFGNTVAVNSVSLDIEHGEFLTLLGPSGSGKTTILMMVAGFQIPTHGMIYVGEEPVLSKPPNKRNIGMVFQNYALFPHKTIFENVAFPLKMRRVNKNEIVGRVNSALELVELSGFGNRYPKQLSGGQQQRIALARALVFNPVVLLMDEPLGALDRKLRDHMQIEIKNLVRNLNITVIYVTHDQQEALTMSDRIAVLNQGEIEQVGTPDNIYENPANWFVADFVGESNLIRGIIDKINGKMCTIMVDDKLKFEVVSLKEISSNKEVKFAIRPEKIFFASEDKDFPNICDATVEEVIYVGDMTKYKLKLINLENYLFLNQQNRAGISKYEKGDKVRIGWSPEDAKILGFTDII